MCVSREGTYAYSQGPRECPKHVRRFSCPCPSDDGAAAAALSATHRRSAYPPPPRPPWAPAGVTAADRRTAFLAAAFTPAPAPRHSPAVRSVLCLPDPRTLPCGAATLSQFCARRFNGHPLSFPAAGGVRPIVWWGSLWWRWRGRASCCSGDAVRSPCRVEESPRKEGEGCVPFAVPAQRLLALKGHERGLAPRGS